MDLRSVIVRSHACSSTTGGDVAENAARLKALLVGPGAYRTRLPAWAFWLVRQIAGDRLARVPVAQIETIGSAVQLKCRAEDVKLHAIENKVRRWIPRGGAL